MLTQLKKAIFDYIVENENQRQRLNNAVSHFERYIYDEKGEFLIWGREVYDWICKINDLI